jgi:hypothetical protein
MTASLRRAAYSGNPDPRRGTWLPQRFAPSAYTALSLSICDDFSRSVFDIVFRTRLSLSQLALREA